jgi:hypothetical protein
VPWPIMKHVMLGRIRKGVHLHGLLFPCEMGASLVA